MKPTQPFSTQHSHMHGLAAIVLWCLAGPAVVALASLSTPSRLAILGDAPPAVRVAPCNASKALQLWDFETGHLRIRGQSICLDAHGCNVGGIVITWGCDAGQPNQVYSLQANGTLYNSQVKQCASPLDSLALSSVFCKACSDSSAFTYDAKSGLLSLKSNASLCLDVGTPLPPCDSRLLYCNASYTPHERAVDLVSRMTLSEKAHYMNQDEVDIARLGVPGHRFGEALHGVVSGCGACGPLPSSGCPTSFPHSLAQSSAFNRTLWRAIGDVVATEARALTNQGTAASLVFAPDINLFRDPRWGRGQEVPGEDPILASEYVTHYSRGLQEGPDAKYLRVVSTAKHFVAYDIEGNHGVSRDSFNAVVSEQDLVEYYMPAFRAAVEGAHVQSVMCSYNAVNGVAACSNGFYLNQVLREQWQFDGFVVSDCGAISDPASRAYAKTTHASDDGKYLVYNGITGGCDISCGDEYNGNIEPAVRANILPESDVDRALTRMLEVLFKFGFMDPNVSYMDINKYGPAQVDTPAARQLALEASQQSMVLLKNSKNILPLKSPLKVAVLGPHFNATDAMLSIYRGTAPLFRTPLQGISGRSGVQVVGAVAGCDVACSETVDFPEAVNAATAADVAIVFVGLMPGQMTNDSSEAREDEGWDRQYLTLPGHQEELVKQVYAANRNTVVVLVHGGPLAIEWTQANIPAILDAHYPGEMGGDAIASVLFGDVSPAGRLTTTVYPATFIQQRPISDMNLRDNGGITYMHYKGTPLWEFGYGLSYTTFDFQPLSSKITTSTRHLATLWLRNRKGGTLPVELSTANSLKPEATDTPSYTIRVTNTGNVTSDCVVLGFVSSNHTDAPFNKELFDFARISNLAPKESKDVLLSISAEVLALVDNKGAEYIAPGTYQLTFGVRGAAETNVSRASLVLSGAIVSLAPSLEQMRHAHLSK